LQEKNEGLDKLIKKYEEEKSGKTFEIDRITEEKKIREEESAGIIDQITEINKNILLLQRNTVELRLRRQSSSLRWSLFKTECGMSMS